MSRLMNNRSSLIFAALSAAALAVAGCEPTKPKVLATPFETLPPKQLPAFLSGTILARMDHTNPDAARVSNYGLVVDLPGTGDGVAPSYVRDYIIREMSKHTFGSARSENYANLSPSKILDSHKAAIVRIDGYMPPGIRKGASFDIIISALPDSGVTSLADGRLYRSELKFGGADTQHPEGVIDVAALAEGTLFIDPSITLNPHAAASDRNAPRFSRRQGLILDGGIATVDQPLILRLRAPQRSVMRQIQARINDHFQNPSIADPKNEAIMHLIVPTEFRGDWERFIGVAMNLFMDGRPEILTIQSRKLAEEAIKPDAPLQNISFAWEGMGEVALPAIAPLMSEKYPQDVQFAAARAAAFIGDPAAPAVLARMAATTGHQFQVDAVRTLGSLPPGTGVDRLVSRLLNSDSALVRVAAYQVLARRNSGYIVPTVMPKPGKDERFVMDMVPSAQPPLIYATRSGIPRIAIIGSKARIVTPMTFAALDNRLTISSAEGQSGLSIFFRPEGGGRTVQVRSRENLAELIGWLGGYAPDPRDQINLSYGDIVAIIQALSDKHLLVSDVQPAIAANFVLQETAGIQDEITDAPPIVPRARPSSEEIPGLPTTRTGSVSLGK